jgi:hypothetical protein
LEVIGPQAGVIAAAPISQSRWAVCLVIAGDPMVDAHAAGVEHASDFGDGASRSGLQDGQGTAEQARISGIAQLLFQSASLGVGQSQATHRNLG